MGLVKKKGEVERKNGWRKEQKKKLKGRSAGFGSVKKKE